MLKWLGQVVLSVKVWPHDDLLIPNETLCWRVLKVSVINPHNTDRGQQMTLCFSSCAAEWKEIITHEIFMYKMFNLNQ